ncbi:MAG: hypothetical protein IJM51_05655 [Clostridia bacterium]|nr:hypothetical protein [Clostridia bacterium]
MEKILSDRQTLSVSAADRPGHSRVRLLLVMLGCFAALLLTGCGMNTDLNIDGSFKGERVITCDELSDQNGLFTKFKVSEAADVLSQKCPPQMSFECKYTNDSKTKAVFVFHLKFDSIDDYKSKVKELIGRNPTVQFTYKDPKEDLFASGFSITEDFESKDLLAWVKPALKDELNVSKDVSSMTDTVKVTMDGVSHDNENFGSAKVKINTISKYQIDSLEIRTVHDVDKEGAVYEREVTVKIPKKTVEALGKDNIQAFMENGLGENATGKWKSDDDGASRYRVSFKGSSDVINDCTSKLFGEGCSFQYVSDGSLNTAFSETGVLTEKVSFTKFPCRSDGTCDATFTYVNMDGSRFDDSKSSAAGSSTKKTDDDGKTLVVMYEKAGSADITVYASSVYSVAKVNVVTDISSDDKVMQEISIAYKVGDDDSGAKFAAKYFNETMKGSGIDIAVEPFNASRSQYAVVLTTPRGTAEETTALLQKYIGQGNSVKIEGEDKFAVFNKRSVTVNVDIAEFVSASGYTGVTEYGFRGDGEASSVSWTSAAGKGKNDVLMGKSQSEFSHPISEQTFTVSYQVQRINLIFVMLMGGIAIVACGAVIMLFSGLVLRRRRKRQQEKMEAVMTMALVKLPDGTQQMMEVTPEEAANAVVIAPKDDDGLDEDDDEPENMWLFTTAMRLFAAMAGVLVALNYAGVDSERNVLNPLEFFNSAKGVSGWDLIVGKEISDRMLEGSYFNAVLIIVPLVIFLLLSLRNLLPKLMSDIVIIGVSLFQAWYMLGLQDTLAAKVDLLGVDGKRFFVEMDWAYNYSVVIYVMLFVGAVVLILMDTGLNFRRMLRRKER